MQVVFNRSKFWHLVFRFLRFQIIFQNLIPKLLITISDSKLQRVSLVDLNWNVKYQLCVLSNSSGLNIFIYINYINFHQTQMHDIHSRQQNISDFQNLQWPFIVHRFRIFHVFTKILSCFHKIVYSFQNIYIATLIWNVHISLTVFLYCQSLKGLKLEPLKIFPIIQQSNLAS